MATSTIYSETPRLTGYRIFELKNDILVVETFISNQSKSTAEIQLSYVALPSFRIKGRNIKVMKGSASVIVMIIVLAMSACAIFPDSTTWIWAVAAAIGLLFLPSFLQSVKIVDSEIFKSADGRQLFDLRREKGNEEEFEAFLSTLTAAIQQSQATNVLVRTAGDGVASLIEGAMSPPALPQTAGSNGQSHSGPSPSVDALEKKIKSGAHWLYWVAAMSGINIVLTYLETTWRFAIGLGITELIYAIGLQFGTIGTTAASLFTLAAIGGLVGLGAAAVRQNGWAFIGGIIALGLDTLLLIALAGTEVLMGIVFHVVAVVYLCLGYKALRTLKKLNVPLLKND